MIPLEIFILLLHINLDKDVREDFSMLNVHIKGVMVYSSVLRSCAA